MYKMMKRGVLMCGVVMILAFQVSAQDTLKLTFKDAVKTGLKNNVTLNQAKNMLEARQAARNQSFAALGPNLFAQGGGARNIGQQPNPENGNLENLTVDNFSASVNANLTLFNGFARVNLLKSS